VKSAVSEAIKEQQKVISDRSSIVVYGFPEEGHDTAQLLDMFAFLDCRCDVIRQLRIGRNLQSTARPIKVELRSASDASVILARAKSLRKDKYYAGIYISKWLSDEEMKSLKQLRLHCDVLNRDRPVGKDGRKQFIIISGRLMKRNASGRLEAYNDTTASSRSDNVAIQSNKPAPGHISSLSSSQPKNAQ
jgi:hypothetical protein